MNKETRDEYIAYCHICLLASNMRDCPNCKFNIGLPAPVDSLFARVLSRQYVKQDAGLTERDCLHIQYAAYCQKSPLAVVDFQEINELIDHIAPIRNSSEVDGAHIRAGSDGRHVLELGTRVIVSGGEVLELDAPKDNDDDYSSWWEDPF